MKTIHSSDTGTPGEIMSNVDWSLFVVKR